MNKRIHINPILKKDMLVSSRSVKMVVTITLINSLFACIVAAVLLSGASSRLFQSYYTNIISIFPILALCELGVISLVMPVLTATSISGERERQTLEIMLTTPVKPVSIVIGKIASATATTVMYVIASMPFIAIAFMVGGLGWSALFKFIGAVLFVDIYVGSFGVYFSSKKRTSVSATISTIAMIAAIIILTIIAAAVLNDLTYTYNSYTDTYTSYNYAAINIQDTVLLFNPACWIFEMFLRLFYNESVLDALSFPDKTDYGQFVISHFVGMSIVANLMVVVLLVWLASRKVVTGGKRRKKRRKGAEL